MPDRTLMPQVQYATLEQQGETAQLGMWVFLTTEILFIGSLFFTYFVYRLSYPQEIVAAAGHAVFWCGTVNLALLLTSSLTMVLAINGVAQGRRSETLLLLLVTAILGLIFLGIKGYEYYLDFQGAVIPGLHFEKRQEYAPVGLLFWFFYFVGTGLHAVHLSIGIALVLYMLWRVYRFHITSAYYAPLEVVGLYWCFVDAVWVFLYPSIYLPGRA